MSSTAGYDWCATYTCQSQCPVQLATTGVLLTPVSHSVQCSWLRLVCYLHLSVTVSSAAGYDWCATYTCQSQCPVQLAMTGVLLTPVSHTAMSIGTHLTCPSKPPRCLEARLQASLKLWVSGASQLMGVSPSGSVAWRVVLLSLFSYGGVYMSRRWFAVVVRGCYCNKIAACLSLKLGWYTQPPDLWHVVFLAASLA